MPYPPAPMLATAAQLPAEPHGWVAEAKLDGVGLLPGTENGDDAVTFDEDEDGGVGRHLDGVIVAVTASSAR